MTGTESTPKQTQVDHRWDSPSGREDREVYDEIFDEAILMIGQGDPVGKLLIQIINSWERNRRAVEMPILSAAYEVVQARQEARDRAIDQGLKEMSGEPMGYAS